MILGREAEVSVLRRLCRSAAAGAGGTVVVEGLPGIGKSTLLHAVARTSEGLVPRWGRVPEEGGAPPFWPWREIALAGGWDVDWEGAPDRYTLMARVAAGARAAATREPLLLIVEDLHAADDATWQLTVHLAQVLEDAPIALLVSSRPDARLDGLVRWSEILVLGPLDDEDADRLVDRHAPPDLGAGPRRIIKKTAEGNPLVLRELSLAASGGAIPRGVRVAVEQRLTPLSADARHLVDCAAVLGRRCDVGELSTIAGRTRAEVMDALDPVVGLGLMTVDGETLAFSHQIVRDVVDATVSTVDRLDMRRRAGEAAERDGRRSQAAHHLLAAVPLVEPAVAVAAARDAASAAGDARSWEDQVRLLEAALEVSADDATSLVVLLDLGRAQLSAGRVTDAVATFDRAEAAAEAAGDDHRRGLALLGRTERFETLARVRDHLPRLGAAVERARDGHDQLLLSRLLSRRSALRIVLNERGEARIDAQEAVEIARQLGDARLVAGALIALHQSLWDPGSTEQALDVSAELGRVADTTGDADLQLEASLARCVDALRVGDLDGARAGVDRAAEIAAESGSLRHEFFVLSRRAMLAFVDGHLADGAGLIRRAHELGRRIEEPDTDQVCWGAQFLVLAELHSPDELLETADEIGVADPSTPGLAIPVACLRAAAGVDPPYQAHRLAELVEEGEVALEGTDLAFVCLMAQVAILGRDPRLAALLEPALDRHRGRFVVNAGAVTFFGLVDHWSGSLAAVRGRVEEASRCLTVALDRYREIGARFFVDRVQRELAALAGERSGGGPAAADPVDRRVGVLRPGGDGWELGWLGSTFTMGDARGLQHLHRIVAVQGQEIHAADLVTPGSSALVGAQARDALLDDEAKRAYRARITDLQAEVERAARRGQTEREARAQSELDLLLDELRRAVGLRGRDRHAPDDAERARMAVRKAISSSLARVAEHDPVFAAHLRTSVRTGLRCAYVPDPTLDVRWTLA